jgi:Rrf2 family protein
MKFSTKSTYGLRAIARLAKNWGEGNVSLASIAEDENISLAYLERIFARLKRSNIVKAEKGATGGYRLIKKPQDLSALEVIQSLEGKNSLFHCLNKNGKIFCSLSCDCTANQALVKVELALNKTLERIKLSELVGTRNM